MKKSVKATTIVLLVLFVGSNIEFVDRQLSPGFFKIVPDAEARVGRPLTPLSYAGVARRSTRRTVRRTAVWRSTLPASCAYGPYYGAYYYNCAGAYYEKSGNAYVQVVFE
jgi:hypothetical protein